MLAPCFSQTLITIKLIVVERVEVPVEIPAENPSPRVSPTLIPQVLISNENNQKVEEVRAQIYCFILNIILEVITLILMSHHANST